MIDWLLRRHAWAIERDWIVLVPGVVPSLHAAILAFTQLGDKVIVQAQELCEILRIAKRYDLVVVADEIHADLVYPEFKHSVQAALARQGERIITAVAPSKTFNIPGLGLSCLIVLDADDRAAIAQVFDSLHLQHCNPFSSVAFEAELHGAGSGLLASLALRAALTGVQRASAFVRHAPG